MKWRSLGLSVFVLTVALFLAGCLPDGPTSSTGSPVPPPGFEPSIMAPDPAWVPPPPPEIRRVHSTMNIYVYHDDVRSVTCYSIEKANREYSTALSCLPDSALAKPSPESVPVP